MGKDSLNRTGRESRVALCPDALPVEKMAGMATLNDLLSFLQGASNSAAATVSAPVDGINWLLKKAGVPVSDKPVGGSDWLKDKGLMAEPKNPLAGYIGEAVGGVAPMLTGAYAPQIAKGINQMAANAATPAVLRKESGMFIGPSAKTWDAEAAKKAQTLAAKGVDPRQIWKETGTFKGPDGAWRQEIDDTEAVFPRIKNYKRAPFEEMAMHEPLEAAYPDVKNIILEASPGNKLSGGEYRANVNFHDFGPRESITIRNTEESLMGNKSIGLHELQHAIQQREGWAKGGSPQGVGEYVRLYSNDKSMFDEAVKRMIDPGSDEIAKDNARQIFGSLGPKLAKRKSWADADTAYRHLAGEAEARATQARMNMNAAQRRELFPLDSYDVPVDQLIIRGLLD